MVLMTCVPLIMNFFYREMTFHLNTNHLIENKEGFLVNYSIHRLFSAILLTTSVLISK